MKRLLRIFELSKNEQRVILIVMLILIVVAFLGYEHRVHHGVLHAAAATESKASPSPLEPQDEQ